MKSNMKPGKLDDIDTMLGFMFFPSLPREDLVIIGDTFMAIQGLEVMIIHAASVLRSDLTII